MQRNFLARHRSQARVVRKARRCLDCEATAEVSERLERRRLRAVDDVLGVPNWAGKASDAWRGMTKHEFKPDHNAAIGSSGHCKG